MLHRLLPALVLLLSAAALGACDSTADSSTATTQLGLHTPFDDILLPGGSDTADIELDGHFVRPSGESVSYSATVEGSATASVEGTRLLVRLSGTEPVVVLITARTPSGRTGEASFRIVSQLADLSLEVEPGTPIAPLSVPTLVQIEPDQLVSFTISQEGQSVEVTRQENVITLVAVSHGITTLTILAQTRSGLTRSLQYHISVVVPDRIETAPAVLRVGALRVKVALRPDYVRHVDGSPLTFRIGRSTPAWLGATLATPDTLLLHPLQLGTGSVEVVATDRGREERFTLPVEVAGIAELTCDPAPAGKFDPFPFRSGDVVGFNVSVNSADRDGLGYDTFVTTAGTLTWTIRSTSCANGATTLVLDERVQTTTRRGRTNQPSDSTRVDETTRHSVTFKRSDGFPSLGEFVGKRLGPPGSVVDYFAPTTAAHGPWDARAEFKTEADASGLLLWSSSLYMKSGARGQLNQAITVTRRP